MVLVIGVAIAALYIFSGDAKFSLNHQYRTVEAFRDEFNKIEVLFSDQHKESFNLLRNSGIRHLKKVYSADKTDLTPMSYLIVTFQDSHQAAAICFGEKLSEVFTQEHVSKIDSSEFDGHGDIEDNTKMKLDNKIKASLKNAQKVVLVQNIQKLSFIVAQLFMTYADSYNDIATYPQSTIILTANLPLKSTGDRKQDENLVAEYFRETLWKGQANINSIAALWTRVGDGLVVLKSTHVNPCLNQYDI